MAVLTTATLNKVLLHACPRCQGDLFLDLEDEQYGCLQCGREFPLARVEALVTVDALLAAAMMPGHPVPHLMSAVAEEWNDDAA